MRGIQIIGVASATIVAAQVSVATTPIVSRTPIVITAIEVTAIPKRLICGKERRRLIRKLKRKK